MSTASFLCAALAKLSVLTGKTKFSLTAASLFSAALHANQRQSDPVEKKLKALEPRQLYDQSKELTRLYRAHLAVSLRGLGYETYLDRQRCPQIRGVDKNLITIFSKRSAQRDTLVALREQQLGRSLSKTEVARVVHQNRAKKQQRIDPEALRKFQLEQLPPAGRLRLEKLKEQAMAAPRQPFISPARTLPPMPGVTIPGHLR